MGAQGYRSLMQLRKRQDGGGAAAAVGAAAAPSCRRRLQRHAAAALRAVWLLPPCVHDMRSNGAAHARCT